MAKLNYMDRDNLLKEFEIQDDLITLGREATNKLVIADPSVSRQHAWVERKEDGYYLVDKNSSNGTFINGKKVSQQKLVHNDKISLGNASIVFEDEEQVQATFILPRKEVTLEAQDTEPSKKEGDIEPAERPTAAMDLTPPPRPASPIPPAPPAPPPRPAAPPPPPAAPAAAAAANVCPSCKKPIEPGARFCGSCGAPIAAAPRPAAAPPTPPPPPRPAAPAPPPPAQPAATPRPAAPPPPPAPQPARPAPAPPPPPAHPLSMGVPSAPAPAPRPAGNLEYAGFGPRLLAYLIDAVVLGLLNLLPAAVIVFASIRAQSTGSAGMLVAVELLCSLIIFVISVGYQVYFVGAKGATPGKRIMKLKVAFPDGTWPIGYGKAFVRMIGYMISGMICYIGFFMIIFDKEMHRGLHDKIAGTVVIREP